MDHSGNDSLNKLLEKALTALPQDKADELAGNFPHFSSVKDNPLRPGLIYFERAIEDMSLEIARLRERNEELMMEQMQLENAISMANDMALKAASDNHLKSQFLADMSHEIRTPMNAVLGMASMMEGTELTEEQRDFIETIRKSGETLIDLINDILDFSKIEAQRMDLEEIHLKPEGLINDTIRLLRLKAEDKDLSLKEDITSDAIGPVAGDPTRIRQILINLAGNAIKFTHKGGITIGLRKVHCENEGRVRLRFFVQDTGIGIPKDKIDRLFRPFSQVDASTTRNYGGTGLGLAISNRLCQLMNGRMWIESVQGEGSTFLFEIELVQLDHDPEEEAKKEALEASHKEGPHAAVDPGKVRILLAEDNPVNSKVATLLLKRAGYIPDLAENGHEVLDAFKEKAYDIVLMDVQMPEMDGIEATRKLRKQMKENPPSISIPRPYIIALTASAGKPDHDRCIAAGMDAFLTKPIRVEEMLKLIREAPLQGLDA